MWRRLNLQSGRSCAISLSSFGSGRRLCATTATTTTDAVGEDVEVAAVATREKNAQLTSLREALTRTQHEMSLPELCQAVAAARKLGGMRETLNPILDEMKARLDNGTAVKKLSGHEACEILETFGNAGAYSKSDAVSNALMSQVLNSLHDCKPNYVVGLCAAIAHSDAAAAKLLVEAALPMVSARSNMLSLYAAKMGIQLAVRLQMFDSQYFHALEDQVSTLLREKPMKYLDVIQFFGKSKYTPTTRFFESWATLGGNAFNTESKDALLNTLKALQEMRRKPSSCFPLIDALAAALTPMVSSMYITEIETLVTTLADLGYVNRNAPRTALGALARNEEKIFSRDGIVVAAADRVLQLKDNISMDIIKNLCYGFSTLNAHYFRLWKFFSDSVKAVLNDIDPPVLVSIVKHMARARFCDESLWKKVSPLLLNKLPTAPPQAIGQWSDALLVTVTSRRSKTTDLGEPVKGSLVASWSQILDALTRRMIEILNTISLEANLDRQLAFAFQQLQRTIYIFYPMEDYALMADLNAARQSHFKKKSDKATDKGTASPKETLTLESASADFEASATATASP